MLYNKKLVIEYVGTDFAGWQVQPNGRTVQEELHKALSRMYKKPVTCIGSGRTDSGVHALGQVASYRTDRYIPPENVQMGMNSMLPDDISIVSAEDVPEDFHAQLSATSKTYMYKIFASRTRSALHAGRTWWVKDNLDHQLMGEYLKLFEGKHDFTSFCVQTSLRENNVRTINSTKCYMDGDVICLEINGSGFLHNMVRIISGTVVETIRKELGAEYILEALNGKNRELAGPTAHPCGLYLKQVFY